MGSRKTIIVSKYGSVFRTRADMRGATGVGEQGETEGILRHLLDRGDCDVLYFGAYQGEVLPGLRVVLSDRSPMKEVGTDPLCVTKEMQVEGWLNDRENVSAELDGEPVGLVCVNGYSPTFSHVHNPREATVQCAALNYAAPVLALCESFKLPRLCVNNDPRTYPRDQEMSYGWEWARPRALLDQWVNETRQVVGGRAYRRVSVHARVESWAYLPEGGLPWSQRNKDHVEVIAHAHIQDGIRNGSVDAWDRVFDDAPPTRVYSRGWEHYPGYDSTPNVTFCGPVKDPIEIMDRSLCCPVVSHSPGFYTGKPYLLASRGCVPLLFGGTRTQTQPHSHTYDPEEFLLELDSSLRIECTGEFRAAFEEFTSDKTRYANMIDLFKLKLKPDYSRLDRLVDELLAGTWQEDPERWGGYFAV